MNESISLFRSIFIGVIVYEVSVFLLKVDEISLIIDIFKKKLKM